MDFHSILKKSFRLGATEIRIESGQPVVFEIPDALQQASPEAITAQGVSHLMKSITPKRCQSELREKGEVGFGFAFGDEARYHVSITDRDSMGLSIIISRDPLDDPSG